ncbi:unnamed protein product [Fasciola hepatica]|uniref:hydroxymethylglutaryl-CoA lyase n=1 Tax=Fasciola hepatica TaxID=6192 RepID=A0ABC9HG79_FASHE|nr:unnamed protein product [Fasciola hepatica]
MLFCRRFARLVRVPQCYSSSKLLLKLVEVGPRDGLQNEISIIPTEIKVSLINQLTEAGLQFVEVSSFVNPKWVPQLADALQVFRQIKRCSLTRYSALVPNIQGFMDALEAKPDEVAVFTAASETFAKRNINCSIDESIKRFDEVLHLAKSQAIPVRGYVSCALGCPYEGSVSPDEVARVAELLWNIGCYEISLGDTVGRGTPESMNRLLTVMLTQGGACPREAVAVHCHDTGGNALANIGVALDHHGIRVVDSAIGGLGGCPYAGPDAPGNVATEAVVRYVLDKGYILSSNLKLEQLIATGVWIRSKLQKSSWSSN